MVYISYTNSHVFVSIELYLNILINWVSSKIRDCQRRLVSRCFLRFANIKQPVVLKSFQSQYTRCSFLFVGHLYGDAGIRRPPGDGRLGLPPVRQTGMLTVPPLSAVKWILSVQLVLGKVHYCWENCSFVPRYNGIMELWSLIFTKHTKKKILFIFSIVCFVNTERYY